MKRTLIAAAVLSVAGAAQAAPAYLYNGTEVAQSVWITGFFGIYGCVSVDNSAGAVVNNTQVASLGGVSMSPTAQTYYKGQVTTSVDQTSAYNNSSGSGYKYHDSTSSFSNTFAEGSASTKNKSHNSSSSAAAAGGYGYSTTAMTAHTTSAGGTLNAGGALSAAANGAVGWSNSTTSGVTGTIVPPSITFFNSGNSAVAGALNAAFTLGGYLQETTNSGSTDAASGAGAGYIYGAKTSASNSSSSKSQAYASYKQGTKESHSASDWGWSSESSHDWGSTRVHGSVTEYVNTQVPGTSTASIGNGALSNATGNVGVNIASGIDNAQSNNAALSSIDSGNVFGNAQVFSQQTSTGGGTINNFNLAATVGDNALASATGNVGVNVASGLGNVQNNSLALVSSTPSSSHSAKGALVATDDSTQMANAYVNGTFNGAASLGAGALNNATGNIGVNIAAGGGNLQHNGLAVASIKLGQ
jgi:hypothetical protein